MDVGDYFKFVLALIFVLGLIGVLALLVRRYGFGMSALQKRADGRRLQVVEIRPLDARRRLVLVRRDDVEHLILLGASSEIIIEGGFQSPPMKASEQMADKSVHSGDYSR
jgi:flagellar protein FliO/FliZ